MRKRIIMGDSLLANSKFYDLEEDFEEEIDDDLEEVE